MDKKTETAKPGPGRAPGYVAHPGHSVVIQLADGRVSATCNGVLIAISAAALMVREGGYAPVTYFPAADVQMDRMTKTDHLTHCPFKGDASYWTISVGDGNLGDGAVFENAAWGYEDPFDEALDLKGHIAFYADKVDISS